MSPRSPSRRCQRTLPPTPQRRAATGRSGNHWQCITPGAYCPAAAHGKYGYAKVTKRRYKCSYYSSDGRWHWKRAY
ncbi:hypothetical protein N5079_32670 [Planotetraspora sp. A-T 1434]|uniref:hypothetical protein n=1 Tax=Planotetraspora sp. A-T 1434 TaxID=2979219 RepID=UPI0021BFD6FF|nr:hypothetical protein [Planotetraspora sp. A-T 1434]MCT9934970.1 hypothetical protein [Planotetraspora sp. A-T 1434]